MDIQRMMMGLNCLDVVLRSGGQVKKVGWGQNVDRQFLMLDFRERCNTVGNRVLENFFDNYMFNGREGKLEDKLRNFCNMN